MNAYIETLYERLSVAKDGCIQQMGPFLQSEIVAQQFDIHRPDKFDAYLEAYRRRPQKNYLPDLVVATVIEAVLENRLRAPNSMNRHSSGSSFC